MQSDFAVYCADVGSVRGGNQKFGWAGRPAGSDGGAMLAGEGGVEALQSFTQSLISDLSSGRPVALGFECPLFVPVPSDPHMLGAPRQGEATAKGVRPWSAAAGASALATGLVQAAWVLRALRAGNPDAVATLEWGAFVDGRAQLFLWEAFISGEAKAASHAGDAAIAINLFLAALPTPGDATAVSAENPLSLVVAAALHAGWEFVEERPIRDQCLVIKG